VEARRRRQFNASGIKTTTRQAADAIAPIACRGFANKGDTGLPAGEGMGLTEMPVLVLFDYLNISGQIGTATEEAESFSRCAILGFA
jgi:hypothetical protein